MSSTGLGIDVVNNRYPDRPERTLVGFGESVVSDLVRIYSACRNRGLNRPRPVWPGNHPSDQRLPAPAQKTIG